MGKRILHFIRETLLWLAAGMGLIAIVLVIAAYALNISVVLFRTGSMEPTIPTGSAALVREIPASEVEVGDILTVDRPDRLPVTHRVISVEPGNTPQERVITMQGDANDSPDANPYTITEGKELLGSIPGMAKFIHQLSNPYVLGGITIAAALLVGWAFWLRNDPPPSSGTPVDRDADATATQPQTPPHHSWAVVGLLAAVVAVPSTTQASAADVVEETIRSQYITLTSVYDPATRKKLSPTTNSIWDIGITIDAPSAGQGRVGLQVQGDFLLQVSVAACSVRWSDPPTLGAGKSESCPGESRTVVENLIVAPDEAPQWIDSFNTKDAPWLRLLVTLPPEDADQPVVTAGLRVDVEAAGDEVSTSNEVTPDEPKPLEETGSFDQALARTGSPVLVLLLVALCSMAVGRWFHARSIKKRPRGGAELYD